MTAISPRYVGPDPRRRLIVVAAVFAILGAGLMTRLVDLQVVRPERYVDWGQSQRVESVALASSRGDVLDRNGEQLALSIPQRTIWADPGQIVDPKASAEALAPILGVDAIDLQLKLIQDGRFVYLTRAVPDDVADAALALDIPGIAALEESKRFNPGGDALARSVIGTVGIDNEGLSGIEVQFDELLTGVPGELVFERDPEGRTIPAGARKVVPAQPGQDLMLTIDRSMQFEAERVLVNQVEAMSAAGGTVIISDPRTGDILAMANVDRNDAGFAAPTTENRALTWAYEPGSVMKPITFAAVLEEGLAGPDTARDIQHWYQLYDEVFLDHSEYGTRSYTVRDILTQSSNTGTITWAVDLGPSRMYRYLGDFGFGSPTGLEFRGETAGLVPDVQEWSGTSIGTIPIGQGISVTPMQMLHSYNVIANGGVAVEPRLVRASVDEDGVPVEFPAAESHRVISERTANDLAAIMANVVREGTGTKAAVDGYSIAGKTGTARKTVAGGGYEGVNGFIYASTFAGFFPAEDPQLSMLVVIDEPTVNIFASEVAAPAFAELASYALRRFKVPPPAEVIIGDAPATTPIAPAGADEDLVRNDPAEVAELPVNEAVAGDLGPDGAVAVDAPETVGDGNGQ